MEDRHNTMADRKRPELLASVDKQWVWADHQPTKAFLPKNRECCFNLALAAGLQNVQIEAQVGGSRPQLCRQTLSIRIRRINEHRDGGRGWHQLTHELKPLGCD